MFNKVLVATDLSAHSEKLLPCLYSVCPDIDTEVAVAHVFDDPDDADPDSCGYKKVQSRLRGLINDLNRAGYENAQDLYYDGVPFEQLQRAADETEAELVLVASHGKGFFKSALLGSTTFDLARTTQFPLLICKDCAALGSAEVSLLDKVLIPTDFSKKSLEALNVIRALREHISEIVFVHVIERSRDQQELDEKILSAEQRLTELVDEMRIFGLKASYIVRRGSASKSILRVAIKEKATVIIMAKTGAGLVKGLVIGSTAQNVLLNADCSLLLLPPVDTVDDE